MDPILIFLLGLITGLLTAAVYDYGRTHGSRP